MDRCLYFAGVVVFFFFFKLQIFVLFTVVLICFVIPDDEKVTSLRKFNQNGK